MTKNGNYKSCFRPGCIKDFVKDLLEIETENNFKLNNPMIFNKEDKIYHDTDNICYTCGKKRINKVRDHCHETRKYTGPACNICNLNYRQQDFFPVIFHNDKGKGVDVLPSTNGKARMFRVGILNFIDIYSFLKMSLDKIANVYQFQIETLYPYEYLKDEKSYNNKLGNLSIEGFRSSLGAKLPTQAEVDNLKILIV